MFSFKISGGPDAYSMDSMDTMIRIRLEYQMTEREGIEVNMNRGALENK